MTFNTKISNIVFSVYILLSFYVFGGGMTNSLVAYRTWRWVGEKEFPKFHQIDRTLIIPVFVVFFFISFIPQILLFWYRPTSISKQLVWLALIFNLVALISTIAIQLPIQALLDEKFSMELIDRLISTDMLYRRIPMLLLAVVNFTMLYKVVANSNTKMPFRQE